MAQGIDHLLSKCETPSSNSSTSKKKKKMTSLDISSSSVFRERSNAVQHNRAMQIPPVQMVLALSAGIVVLVPQC
jgi:hypothetical protein